MKRIIGMTKSQLIELRMSDVSRLLTGPEVLYMAGMLDSLWRFDYKRAEADSAAGRLVKPHALLKSERHSDAFLVSKIFLSHLNIRAIMAEQLALRFKKLNIPNPDWVAGIPEGATGLGNDIGMLIGAKITEMEKKDGRISILSQIPEGETLALVEDFCTKGTGFKEAVTDIMAKNPGVKVLPYELVIINRGGLKEIAVEGVGNFSIIPIADYRINDWLASDCPLCKMGSEAIKPKATEESWKLINS